MSSFASIYSIVKIQYFQQVVYHIMKSVWTCTYIYTYHDFVESQCSPRKLRFGVPFPAPYLVKPDCSAHRFINTLAVSRTLYSDKTHIVSTSWYTKNERVDECPEQLHSLYLVCVKSKAVQIAKIQANLHLYYRTKYISRFGVCD